MRKKLGKGYYITLYDKRYDPYGDLIHSKLFENEKEAIEWYENQYFLPKEVCGAMLMKLENDLDENFFPYMVKELDK